MEERGAAVRQRVGPVWVAPDVVFDWREATICAAHAAKAAQTFSPAKRRLERAFQHL